MKIIQVWFEYFMFCITLYKTSKMQLELWKAIEPYYLKIVHPCDLGLHGGCCLFQQATIWGGSKKTMWLLNTYLRLKPSIPISLHFSKLYASCFTFSSSHIVIHFLSSLTFHINSRFQAPVFPRSTFVYITWVQRHASFLLMLLAKV